MLALGENGWIKYGWGTSLDNQKQHHDILYINLLPALKNLPADPPLEIAVKCIEKISRTYPPPYNLMCSGGTDSQAMCFAWLKSSIPFNVISIKYVSNNIWWNQHDLITLEKFSYVNSLKVDFKEFDTIFS